MENRLCDTCTKEDVCKYKEEVTQAGRDIMEITRKKSELLKTAVCCGKWSGKIHNLRNPNGSLRDTSVSAG
ncbi:MAG: hypothetical protein HFH39_04200 [Lachnospiraceae bacterium]|nr:hypothetical protein [Lachnospiraceae bacterium]